MTQERARTGRASGGPGKFSRWFQRTMNARMVRKIRRGHHRFMGMDMLVLTTVGRRSGEPRETPVAWFPDGAESWLIVASGGGGHHPDWHGNLVTHPEKATIELPDRGTVPVTPHELTGADRERAWTGIVEAQPRYGKYQSKSGREYPVLRLTPRSEVPEHSSS